MLRDVRRCYVLIVKLRGWEEKDEEEDLFYSYSYIELMSSRTSIENNERRWGNCNVMVFYRWYMRLGPGLGNVWSCVEKKVDMNSMFKWVTHRGERHTFSPRLITIGAFFRVDVCILKSVGGQGRDVMLVWVHCAVLTWPTVWGLHGF